MDSPARPVDESMLARVNGKTSGLTTGHNDVRCYAAHNLRRQKRPSQRECVTSLVRGEDTTEGIWIKLCILVDICDVVKGTEVDEIGGRFFSRGEGSTCYYQ